MLCWWLPVCWQSQDRASASQGGRLLWSSSAWSDIVHYCGFTVAGRRCLGNRHICMFRLNVYKLHWYPLIYNCQSFTVNWCLMQYLRNCATSQQKACVHCSNSQMWLMPVHTSHSCILTPHVTCDEIYVIHLIVICTTSLKSTITVSLPWTTA